MSLWSSNLSLPFANQPLRTKLVAVFAMVFTVLAVWFYVWIPNLLNQAGLNGLKHRAVGVATVLGATSGAGLDFNDREFLDEQLGFLSRDPLAVYANVRTPSEDRLATWGDLSKAIPMDMTLDSNVMVDAEVLHVIVKITGRGGAEGVLQAGFSLRDLHLDHRNRAAEIAIVSSVLLVLGIGLSFILGTVLIHPIVRTAEAAMKVARGEAKLGDLHLGVESDWSSSQDEAVRLAGSISLMASRLDKEAKQVEKQRRRAVEAEKHAVEASKTKSAFLANMSHELRTPLNAIIGYSEMLLEEATDDLETEAASDLKRIVSSGRHLSTLINDILDLSKIEAGKMEVYVETIDVGQWLEQIVCQSSSLIEAGGNTFSTSHSEDLGIIRSDVTKLNQIVLNLLSNAGKFTENGSVVFRVERHLHGSVESIVVEVRDTGIGMTQVEQVRLFKDFSQADISTTKRYGGTGLGLSLSKRFAAMLEGEIWVESEEGVGSTFYVRLPAFMNEDLSEGVSVGAE